MVLFELDLISLHVSSLLHANKERVSGLSPSNSESDLNVICTDFPSTNHSQLEAESIEVAGIEAEITFDPLEGHGHELAAD